MKELSDSDEGLSYILKSWATQIQDLFHAKASTKPVSDGQKMTLMNSQEGIAATAAGAAASVGSKVTLAGSAGSVFGWLTSNATGMWAGVLIGLLGLLVNAYFKHLDNKRKQEAHILWKNKLQSQSPSNLVPLQDMGAEE